MLKFGVRNTKGNEVAVFKDRVDIYNPGTFPDELDPQDFVEGDGYSILRNPLIAETMYKSEDIEKWAIGVTPKGVEWNIGKLKKKGLFSA